MNTLYSPDSIRQQRRHAAGRTLSRAQRRAQRRARWASAYGTGGGVVVATLQPGQSTTLPPSGHAVYGGGSNRHH